MSTERKPFPVRLNDAEISMLDELRRVEPDIPTRSEMLRRLIERAIHGGNLGRTTKKPAK